MATYVELQVTSHFSFLRGTSSPEELFAAAALLGHSAMGLADWNTVAGVVRGWDGQKATGVRMIPGARVDLVDGRALLLYPRTRAAWSMLTRLLSIGKGRGGKGKCILKWADIAAHADEMVGILPTLAVALVWPSKRRRPLIGRLRLGGTAPDHLAPAVWGAGPAREGFVLEQRRWCRRVVAVAVKH